MTVDDIKEFYGFKNDCEVAKKYNLSKTAVSNWRRNGIKEKRQALIQVQSNNKLKAELKESTT